MWKDDFFKCLTGSTTENSRVVEALALKELHLPSRIYKYRCDCRYSHDTLGTDTVWLPSPDSFSDPYDCWLTFPDGVLAMLLKSRLGEAAESYSAAVDGLANQAASDLQEIRKLARLCAFSATYNSLLMWSHYADQHKGFCLEYDIGGLKPDHPFRQHLYPVVYSKNIYDLEPIMKGLAARSGGEFRPMLPLLGMLHKFGGWKYEKEWRLIFEKPAGLDDHKQPAPTPSRIFLGSRLDPSKSLDLLDICRKKNIPISRMLLALDKFELLSEPFAG
jgi:hypothetical protein